MVRSQPARSKDASDHSLRFGSIGVQDKQPQSEPPSSKHPDSTRSWVAKMAARGEVSPTDAGVTATDIRNYRSLTIAVQRSQPGHGRFRSSSGMAV
jgi:hypothetical protein